MTAAQAFEAIRAFEEHEHGDVSIGLARVHEAAALTSHGTSVEVRRALRDVLAWSERTLEPHMAWEESWLYPQLELLTGTTWSTRAARFDHGQIVALVAQLRIDETTTAHSQTPAGTDDLRWHLFALEAVLRAHLEREEMLLLPVLDRVDVP